MSDTPEDGRDAAAEGIEHLQAAAVQMIAAARSFLNAAEQVVHRPEVVTTFVTTMGALAKAATQAIASAGASAKPGGDVASADQDRSLAIPAAPPGGPVERIGLG